MPLDRYGVLKGRIVNRRRGVGRGRHYQIHVHDGEQDHRVAVNFKSRFPPSELLFLVDEDLNHPLTPILEELPLGYSDLDRGPASGALDYIRGNLFDLDRMRMQPYQTPAASNDLKDKIDTWVRRAMHDSEASVYAFGEPWGPERARDKYFGFKPGRGMHEVHMNQGNSVGFEDSDGVWQDGALWFHFPAGRTRDPGAWKSGQWIAVFLAFQSQAWHTEEGRGHRLDPESVQLPVDPTGARAGRVRIVAALINPRGEDTCETVTLLNTAPDSIRLDGWTLTDKKKRATVLEDLVLEAGRTAVVDLSRGEARLSNKGGILTLLNRRGGKVDGVSYTREQAMRQGWTVVF